MPLLDRLHLRRQQPDADQPTQAPPSNLRVLRASGQRIDLSARDVGARIAATRQAWQTDAWDYFARIGELSYALRLLAQQVAKVRFFAAELRPYPDDPVELSGNDHDLDERLAAAAVSELARLPLDDDGVDGFLAVLALNLLVAGEAWIHGREVDGEEQWTVRSVSEITAMGDTVMLAELPTNSSLGQRPIRQGEEELLRCWIRSPRYGQLATSPLFSALDIMEGIVLDGRESRAASQSRIAANGVLLVPDSLSLVKARREVEELAEESVRDDNFMGDFTVAMTAPIINEGHAGAVVPLVIRGAADDLKEFRHVKLDRADPEKLTERINAGVLRLLKSVDVQPEQVEGTGSTNHWSGWLISAKDITQQVEPWSATIAGCITKAFLRPALSSLSYDQADVRRVATWRDTSGLAENPNRGQDARDAHAAMVIKDATLRQALGFDDEDAPDDEEIQRRIAAKVGVDQSTAAIVLEMARRAQDGQPRIIESSQNELPAGQSINGARTPGPGEVVPDQPTPQEPASTTEPNRSMVAAATPDGGLPSGWRVDTEAARQLADIDAALAERIIVAADAAIQRAIERAGGRARSAVRNQAKGDAALTAAIDGVATELIPSRVGRDVLLAAASLSDLLSDAFTRLRGQFFNWLTSATGQAANVVSRMLGMSRGSRDGQRIQRAITERVQSNADSSWSVLSDALNEATERAMFKADPLTPDSVDDGEESASLLDPAAVFRALTVAGGGDPGTPDDGGLTGGSVVRDTLTDQGAVTLGWEWRYRPERPRNTFTPHALLDGERFTTWTDPKLTTDNKTKWLGEFMRPGDHRGCRCGSQRIWATPELGDDDVVSRRLREARESDRGRTLTRVAAEDTAAGRSGTSAQREVEVRDRIADDVERLRQHYIEGVRS